MDGVRRGTWHVRNGRHMRAVIDHLGMGDRLWVRCKTPQEKFTTIYPVGSSITPHLRLLAEFLYLYYDNGMSTTPKVGKCGWHGLRVHY